MIIGLTHTANGETVQRLSVSTKVAVGLPPDSNRKAPTKLDFFVFQRKTNKGPGLGAGWELDPALTEHYGKSPREIEIILLDDEPEAIFPTQLAWWTATECKCHGDGERATRRTEANPDGEDWEPCGKTCPDLEEGRCKPSGDLRFMLADFPTLGSICRLHTSSYRSIMQINSAIEQIRTITGGRLAGIRASLVVRAEKTSYTGDDQKKHSTTIPALSLEVKAKGMKELVAGMVSTAHLFEQTKKLLGAGHVQIVEPDEEVAPELNKEFYSLVDAERDKPVKTSKKERERGVLEPSATENRGHEATGLETLKSSAQRTGSQAPKPEVVREAIAEKKPAVLDDPGAKAAVPKDPATEPRVWTGMIVSVGPKLKQLTLDQQKQNTAAQAAKKPEPCERQPYYDLESDDSTVMSVWDANLFPAALKCQKKICKFVVKLSGKGFLSVEEIVEIDGVKYARDPVSNRAVPVDVLAATEKVIQQPAQQAATEKPAQSPPPPPEKVTLQLTGRIREVRTANADGKELRTTDGRKYVTVRMAFLVNDQTKDPHDLFLCVDEKVSEELVRLVGKDVAFTYDRYQVKDKFRQVIQKLNTSKKKQQSDEQELW